MTTEEIQAYQQGELIAARGLLAECLGILQARKEVSDRGDTMQAFLPIVEGRTMERLTEFQTRSLFPKESGQ